MRRRMGEITENAVRKEQVNELIKFYEKKHSESCVGKKGVCVC